MRPMSKTLANAAILLGGLLMLAGFLYGVIFAGIPYPDPSPAQQAAFGRDSALSDGLMAGGAGLTLLGLVWRLVRRGK